MIDFNLHSEKTISKAFRKIGIQSFSGAMLFVKNLPYGRNSNKDDLTLVISENKGTCSSKHALLKSLAEENGKQEVRLMLGMFRMNENNTPKVKSTLQKFKLDYIPEAHNYLKINGKICDCTSRNSSKLDFIDDLILEIEIQANQISGFKVEFHKNYLQEWVKSKTFSLEQIWDIREQCILDLSSNSK